MRFSPLIALLPALVAAQDQQFAFTEKVKGWFDQVKSFLPQAPISPDSAQRNTLKPAAKIPEKNTTRITLDNWRDVLEPSTEPQEWLIFVTGGNKTCFGRCLRADKAFNESIPLFAVDPVSPNLGYLNCEQDPILCAVWAAAAPTVWHLDVPQALPGEPRPEIPLHVVNLNHSTVTPETIFNVYGEKEYEKEPRYEGWLHPWDGILAQYGLNIPLGYVVYGFGALPSWAMMIGMSFISRNIMGRRAANPRQIAGRG